MEGWVAQASVFSPAEMGETCAYEAQMPPMTPAYTHSVDGQSFSPPKMPMRPRSAPGSTVLGVEGRERGLSIHEASRAKKTVESNAKAIENRIKFFKREEEKIWRDLEEVRRQAATIEEGRTRALEKKLADRAIQQERELTFKQNRVRVAAARNVNHDARRQNQAAQEQEKKMAGDDQRRTSQDITRQKRMQEAQSRLQNSERAVAIQRAQLESRMRINQEKTNKVEMIREQHERERQWAEADVAAAEAKLPELEAEELVCLQRLQNSRIVTQSVLEELESSLGKQSAVTSLLRSKQRGSDVLSTMSVGSTMTGTKTEEMNTTI